LNKLKGDVKVERLMTEDEKETIKKQVRTETIMREISLRMLDSTAFGEFRNDVASGTAYELLASVLTGILQKEP
jgi:hypothetical protein